MYVTVPLLCMSIGKYVNFNDSSKWLDIASTTTPFVLCVRCKVMTALAFALDVEC